MKAFLDCFPCALNQSINAARMAGADDEMQFHIMQLVLEKLLTFKLDSTPPEISTEVHHIVREVTGHPDPYHEAKQASTREALSLYPRLKETIADAADPLDMALRLSIAGNIIDLAIVHDVNLWETIDRVLVADFAIDDRMALREALSAASELLYLGDNAGETVFDRLLIETLDIPVRYAVKSGPALNDATEEDALQAGLDSVAELVSTGSQSPGTLLPDCSPEFRELYDAAPLIIAKGQANYESLSEEGPRVFFLLQAKCPCVSGNLGVPLKSIILKQG